MRFAPVAAIVLSLSVLIASNQPTTTRASEDRSISGSVFFDTNKNGQFDFGELPAPGRTVELSRFDDEWHNVDKVKSHADGFYRFDHVPFNVSSLTVGVRTDAQVACHTGDTRLVDTEGGGQLRGKTVSPGSQVNLGVLPTGDGSVAGTFTNDLNENAIHDVDEPPLKGWRLTLQGTDATIYCYSEATTDSDGAFRLATDVDRLNILAVYPPSSVKGPWEWTAPTVPSGNAGSPPNQQERPDLVSKGRRLDVMIHLSTGRASLSGTVFRDLEGDGAKDPMEPFLDCHHVERLLQLSHNVRGVGAIEVNTTATCAANGKFEFSQLEGGDYRIAIPGYFQLPEYYHPWTGRWVPVLGGRHVKDFVIALCPHGKCPEPSATATPTRPVERRPTDVPIIAPPAGIEGDESHRVSTIALLLAVMGLASIFTAVLSYTYRPRHN